jgi:hypothetical protein
VSVISDFTSLGLSSPPADHTRLFEAKDSPSVVLEFTLHFVFIAFTMNTIPKHASLSPYYDVLDAVLTMHDA